MGEGVSAQAGQGVRAGDAELGHHHSGRLVHLVVLDVGAAGVLEQDGCHRGGGVTGEVGQGDQGEDLLGDAARRSVERHALDGMQDGDPGAGQMGDPAQVHRQRPGATAGAAAKLDLQSVSGDRVEGAVHPQPGSGGGAARPRAAGRSAGAGPGRARRRCARRRW